MKTRLALLSVAIVLSAQLPAAAQSENEVVLATLRDYESAWSRHDAAAIASFYYEPAMRVGRGGPLVRPTRADQKTFFEKFLPGLVERGFERSEWEELNVHSLDSDTAIASGLVIRYRKDGSMLERLAVSYGLRRTEQGWKIFLSASHSPDSVMRFR